ncbi:Mediator of RNA polymerase II transcription subunit 14-like protein [Drosera capensis]
MSIYQVPLIHYCQQLASTLSNHDTCFTQAADSLFFMHEGLQQARAPIYDVPSAIEILLTGTYQRLPKCLEDVGTQSSLNKNQQKSALKKLDSLVNSTLLGVSLPKVFSEVKISDGTALLCVHREFKVLVTLGYRGHLSSWRILHLELLVGERSGAVKLEELRRHVLGDDLERRMAAAKDPFMTLYSVLHELCVAIVMDTVIRQVHALRMGRWKDAIKFELISESTLAQGGSTGTVPTTQDGDADSTSLKTPGVKIMYWLDLDRNSGISDTGLVPFIKIEPCSDMKIGCVHSTFVIDPSTGKEAEFDLDESCIDVEHLLLKAINCNRYTRLLEIHKELVKNGRINRAVDDVVLHACIDELDIKADQKVMRCGMRESEGQEVLCVRAYGSSFFILGINIRNGLYILQSFKNVVDPSALSEAEESLNLGAKSAAEVFVTLRNKSMLHLFASIGKSLGLQVFEHGAAVVELPKSIINGSDFLLMGLPDCSSLFFLLMQLDIDFKPLFGLVKTHLDQSGKSKVLDVSQFKKIDIGQMQIRDDEVNMSILDLDKVVGFALSTINSGRSGENVVHSDCRLEGSMPASRCPPSSFSSIVDEVFELETGTSTSGYGANISASFNASSSSSFGHTQASPRGIQAGLSSPKWDVGHMQLTNYGSMYNGFSSLPNSNGLNQSQAGSYPPFPGRSNLVGKLSHSKSDQDIMSSHTVEVNSMGTMDDGRLRLLNDSSEEIAANRSARLLSPPLLTAQVQDRGDDVVLNSHQNTRKRKISDLLSMMPSFHDFDGTGVPKRRRFVESNRQLSYPNISTEKVKRCSYGNLVSEANKGNAPTSLYVLALLNVVRHCSLSIKHARLTSQMEELDISFVEEAFIRSEFSNIWFRLPFYRGDLGPYICLRLGRPGSMCWDVKINDQHFRDLWELHKGSNSTSWGSGVRIANTSDIDSHIHYDSGGVVLSYQSVEADSIKKLVADIRRLSNARMFALGMRKLLGVRSEEKLEEGIPDVKAIAGVKGSIDGENKLSEQMRRAFRIEAVGLMSLWFSFGSGVLTRFVVEWESSKDGCSMHVSPDGLWPHTKFLEDFINGGQVASLLDCIRLTAGPLHALAAATRPARAGHAAVIPGATASMSSLSKQSTHLPSQGPVPSNPQTTSSGQAAASSVGSPVISTAGGAVLSHSFHGTPMLAAAGRGGSGIVPSSLLPIDVSVVLRGPYWIRFLYRKRFSIDMRCFAGDQVWLQPATPPKGGSSVGGSLPCPQFRPFIMEHVAQELNGLEPSLSGGQQTPAGLVNSSTSPVGSSSQLPAANGTRVSLSGTTVLVKPGQVGTGPRPAAALTSNLAAGSVLPLRRSPGTGVPAHVRGELHTAIIGLGDDGGYGGGWVPLVALKKVLRGILKYLGVLWLFAQLPDLLKETLSSILKPNEGSLLNLDHEQPALRFFVGGYVYAVSVHRVQLLLQVLPVKRFHHQQQNPVTFPEELNQTEISEICDYFSRHVASEPYDASRVASFTTLLTLPILVLREFLKLIAWKKSISQSQGGDVAPSQKPRIELCLENHAGLNMDGNSGTLYATKSNIHYDRPHSRVDFTLTVVLDLAHIPQINAAGGAAWLPYCVSVSLRYGFGDNVISFLGMEGSHGGRSCWVQPDDWEKCKQRVARTVEVNGLSPADVTQGRLRVVADGIQKTLNLSLQGLKDGNGVVGSAGTT